MLKNPFYEIVSLVQAGQTLTIDLSDHATPELVFGGDLRLPLFIGTIQDPPELLSDVSHFVHTVLAGALMLRGLTVDDALPVHESADGNFLPVADLLPRKVGEAYDPWVDIGPNDQVAIDLSHSVFKIIYRIVAHSPG